MCPCRGLTGGWVKYGGPGIGLDMLVVGKTSEAGGQDTHTIVDRFLEKPI